MATRGPPAPITSAGLGSERGVPRRRCGHRYDSIKTSKKKKHQIKKKKNSVKRDPLQPTGSLGAIEQRHQTIYRPKLDSMDVHRVHGMKF